MLCVSPLWVGLRCVLYLWADPRDMWSPVFPSFPAATQHSVYFSSLSPWFWFVQLEVVERNRCVCICRKTESSNHSSVAFDSSGCIWLRPDKTWAYIESDSVELFVHTWCFGTGLLGWALAWWRIQSPPHHHPPPYWKSHIGALRPELSGKGEGCVGPQAMSVALRKGQRERGDPEMLSQMNPHQSKFRHKVYCASPQKRYVSRKISQFHSSV